VSFRDFQTHSGVGDTEEPLGRGGLAALGEAPGGMLTVALHGPSPSNPVWMGSNFEDWGMEGPKSRFQLSMENLLAARAGDICKGQCHRLRSSLSLEWPLEGVDAGFP
jgi:hypothetical protein